MSVRRNFRLSIAFTISQYTPLYWPYMFQLVTVVRGLSAGEFGLLKAVYYAIVIAAEIPAGLLADRFGRRGALVAAAALNTCGCALYAHAEDFLAFAVAEVVLALSTALHSGADSALLYESYAAEGRELEYGRAAGLVRMSALIASMLAFPLVDLFLIRDGDPTLAYLATAMLSVGGVLSALFLVELPRATTATRVPSGSIRAVLRNGAVVRLLVFGAVVFVLVRAANALFLNPVLAAKGIPVDAYGTVFALTSAAGALAAWKLEPLQRWLGPRGFVFALPFSLFAMYGLLVAVPGPAAALLFCIQGAVGGLLRPYAQTRLNHLVASSSVRATVLSVQSVVWRAGYAVAALALGASLDLVPVELSMLALCGVATLVLGLLVWRVGRSS